MNIFEKFEKVTNYDLYAFMDDYNYFLDNYLQSIASYYKGKQTPSKSAFGMLFHLMAEANKVEQIIALMSSSLSQSTEFWDLVDSLSSMKTKLESTVNMAKWMRSSYVYGYESRSKRKFMLRQNQTMENLAVELGSDDSNQDWVEIAVSNALSELDYDKAGGNLLDVPNTDDPALTTTTVVDVMVGDNILGKDLPAKIELADDDLRALLRLAKSGVRRLTRAQVKLLGGSGLLPVDAA